MMSAPTPDQLAKIAEYSSCDVSDALIKLGSDNGGLLPDVHCIVNKEKPSASADVCGVAYTVKMVSRQDTSAPKPDQHFVDAAPSDSIIVVQSPQECKNAVWGGLMSAAAKIKNTRAVVIHGRCRDLEELRAHGVPVFAKGVSTLGQSPFTRPSELQGVLTLQSDEPSFPSLRVEPGGVIRGDENGVVFLPANLIDQALQAMAKSSEVDERCLKDIEAGKSVAASFKAHRG